MVVARRLPDAALDPALDLVLRARAGDTTAFAQLVHAHERGIYNLVLGIVRNREDAGDVVQEVWVRVARSLPELREPERFAPWLYRIARNCSMDLHKAKKCRPQPAARRDDDEDDPFDVPDPAADEPERALVSLDERRKVWETLGALSESDRTILFLRDSQEMPYAEIAGVLGISNNAAEVRVFRARERFRKHFLHLEERTGPCNVSPLQLSAYAEGDVGDATRIMLERHIDTCQHCAKRVQTIATGRRLYRGMGLFFVPSSTTFAVFEKVQSLLGSLMSAPAAVGAAGAAGATAATATATAVATSAAASTAVAPALAATVATATTAAGSSAGAGLLVQAAGLAATKAAAVIVSTAVIGGVAGYSEEHAMPAQAPQPMAAAVSVPAPTTSADALAAGSSLGPGLAVVTSRGARAGAEVPGASSMAPLPQAAVTTTAREQQRSAAAPPALTSRQGGRGAGKSDDGAGNEGPAAIRDGQASPAVASAGSRSDVAPAAAARAEREREAAQGRDLERERERAERDRERPEDTRREVARAADAERAARESRAREDRAARDARDAKDERKSDGNGARADKDLVGGGMNPGTGVSAGVAGGQSGPANIASAVVANLSSAASSGSAAAAAANLPSAAPAAGLASPTAPSALDGASLAAQISSAVSAMSAAAPSSAASSAAADAAGAGPANVASIASSVAASVASSVEHSITVGLSAADSHGRDRDGDRGGHDGSRGNGDRDDDRGGRGHGR